MTPRQVGHYRLDRLLGSGGMGEVYKAYDTYRDRYVALKLLPEASSDDQEYLKRFQRESHVAARLREPHVIPIHDFGEIDGQLFIDMRLVDGADIGALLDANGRIAPQRAVTSSARSPRPWMPRTPTTSSTATSSHRTSWSRRATSFTWSTSASPGRSAAGRQR